MTLKEMYGCKYINAETELFPLQKWYNMLLDKSVEELSISDVLKMIRQNEFIDIAIAKSIDFLKQNPFAGELYEGELLDKISHINVDEILKHRNDLQQIISDGLTQNETYDWITEDEREEFRKLLNGFNQRILNM